jgi:hypothetical protein
LILNQQSIHRVGSAVGGALPDPAAWAGLPDVKRLHPLLPETRSRYDCNLSSMHKPVVKFSTVAAGSICHHLQSLQIPQCRSAMSTSDLSPKCRQRPPTGLRLIVLDLASCTSRASIAQRAVRRAELPSASVRPPARAWPMKMCRPWWIVSISSRAAPTAIADALTDGSDAKPFHVGRVAVDSLPPNGM